jgi:hypothetical protein
MVHPLPQVLQRRSEEVGNVIRRDEACLVSRLNGFGIAETRPAASLLAAGANFHHLEHLILIVVSGFNPDRIQLARHRLNHF